MDIKAKLLKDKIREKLHILYKKSKNIFLKILQGSLKDLNLIQLKQLLTIYQSI